MVNDSLLCHQRNWLHLSALEVDAHLLGVELILNFLGLRYMASLLCRFTNTSPFNGPHSRLKTKEYQVFSICAPQRHYQRKLVLNVSLILSSCLRYLCYFLFFTFYTIFIFFIIYSDFMLFLLQILIEMFFSQLCPLCVCPIRSMFVCYL